MSCKEDIHRFESIDTIAQVSTSQNSLPDLQKLFWELLPTKQFFPLSKTALYYFYLLMHHLTVCILSYRYVKTCNNMCSKEEELMTVGLHHLRVYDFFLYKDLKCIFIRTSSWPPKVDVFSLRIFLLSICLLFIIYRSFHPGIRHQASPSSPPTS